MNDYAAQFSDGVASRISAHMMLRSLTLSCLGTIAGRERSAFLKCFFCHYVFDDQVPKFEAKIELLLALGTFVDTSTALDMIEGKRPIERPSFHLSFDDGFKNIIINALPVLKKHKVPSLFFVPTSFIGASYEKVSDYCLNIAEYKNPIEMCSWDDLRSAMEAGMEIGSHTRTHARFSDISNNYGRMADEFVGSREDIEKNLGVSCSTISWPYGRMDDADMASVRAVKDAGYRACFGSFRGTVRDGGCDPLMIPRHHFEPQWPVRHVKYFVCK